MFVGEARRGGDVWVVTRRAALASLCLALVSAASPSLAFPPSSCGEQTCRDCHYLTRDEAKSILGDIVDTVEEINFADVPGLWEVVVSRSGKRVPVYMDFTKRFLFSGELLRLGTMENLTSRRYYRLNKVDVSRIPLDDALVLGKPTAPNRIIVFEDPECPFCMQIFGEMRKVVTAREDVAFYIKLFPLKIHPSAAEKARAIICAKSLAMLEESLAGKPIPAPACKTGKVEENTALAQSLGIGSVPALVYPDGMVVPGFAKAEAILSLLEEARASLPAESGSGGTPKEPGAAPHP